MKKSLVIDDQAVTAEDWTEGPPSAFAKLFKEPELVPVGSAQFRTDQPIATRQRVCLAGEERIARVRGSVRSQDGGYRHKAVLFKPVTSLDANRST